MYTRWNLPENEEKLKSAVAESKSIAGVCRILDLRCVGGNYKTIKHHIVRLGLDVSHHTGQGWNKDNYITPTANHHKQTIKAHLLREHGYRCWNCGLSEWMEKPITLELDHIDGVNSNNELSNLRILCANCHSQTPTFRNSSRTLK